MDWLTKHIEGILAGIVSVIIYAFTLGKLYSKFSSEIASLKKENQELHLRIKNLKEHKIKELEGEINFVKGEIYKLRTELNDVKHFETLREVKSLNNQDNLNQKLDLIINSNSKILENQDKSNKFMIELDKRLVVVEEKMKIEEKNKK